MIDILKDSEAVMKKCQRGIGNYKGALDDANNLLAECYGTIGCLSNRVKALEAELLNSLNKNDATVTDYGSINKN